MFGGRSPCCSAVALLWTDEHLVSAGDSAFDPMPSSPVPWEGLTATSLRVPMQKRGRPMEVGAIGG